LRGLDARGPAREQNLVSEREACPQFWALDSAVRWTEQIIRAPESRFRTLAAYATGRLAEFTMSEARLQSAIAHHRHGADRTGDHERMQVELRFMTSVERPDGEGYTERSFVIEDGRPGARDV
jgi:hypothetical protein